MSIENSFPPKSLCTMPSPLLPNDASSAPPGRYRASSTSFSTLTLEPAEPLRTIFPPGWQITPRANSCVFTDRSGEVSFPSPSKLLSNEPFVFNRHTTTRVGGLLPDHLSPTTTILPQYG